MGILLSYPTSYWDSDTIFAKQVLLISNCFTTSLDGWWVGAGLTEMKTNSAFKLSLNWGLALAELGKN
jgi:hypothetical protein